MTDRTNIDVDGSGTVEPDQRHTGTVSGARKLRLVDLRHLGPRDLDPLLIDEAIEWELALDWDIAKSAALVRRSFGARRLGGRAMLDGGEVAGYGYAGLEGHMGVIGDLYVRPAWRGGDTEEILLRSLFDALVGTAGVSRIESQLMLVEAASAKALQNKHPVGLFERFLMTLDVNHPLPPGAGSITPRFRMQPLEDCQHAAAAAVISTAYAAHIDSRINERYRTVAQANRFVHEIVHFPGCASFYGPASYIAFDAATGLAAGISLSSFVAGDVAHIAELCVIPHARRAGLGYELLCRSAETLRHAGAKRISLTVTAANEEAVRLYARCGFREMRRFYAYVWERSWVRQRRE
jgi:ribosomal protein S18 acetylase RimI-like enzyme